MLTSSREQSGACSLDQWPCSAPIGEAFEGTATAGVSCKLTFVGALYNRVEVAESCGMDLDDCDADLILSAYRTFGESFIQRLRGRFALVLEDRRLSLILAARDPLGAYPLYHSATHRSRIFSPSIQNLLCQPDVSTDLNRAALADHLCHRWPRGDETFFSAVKRVPPGHVLREQAGHLEVRRYWDPAPPGSPVDWVREEKIEHFDYLLDGAVARAMESGPAGIYLSGGLDSVSIAAVAAERAHRLGQPAPRALCLAFPHPDCDEELIQREVARQLNLPLDLIPFEVAVGGRGLIDSALRLSASLSAPLQNVWLPAYLDLAKRAGRAGCRIVLTGSGGDEWLTVTPRYAADLFRHLDLGGVYRLWNSIRRSYSLPFFSGLHNVLWTNGVRPLVGSAGTRLLRRTAPVLLRKRRLAALFEGTPGWIAPDPALSRVLRQRTEQKVEEELRAPEIGWYWRDMRTALEHPLVMMEMEETFEYSRQAGTCILHPYWDADLVSFLYRTPPHLLNRGGRSKGLVRQSLARKFPQLGFERQKKATSTRFFESTILNEGAAAWRDLGGSTSLDEMGVVDLHKLHVEVGSILAGQQMESADRVWDVMNLEAWARPRK